MAVVGELSLWVALLIAAWSAAVSFLGAVTNRTPLVVSGARGVRALAILLLIALAGMVEALLSREFTLRHVANYTSSELLPAYTVAASWVGGAGALLFCTAAVAVVSVGLQTGFRGLVSREAPLANGFLATILCFLLAILVFRAEPFARFDWVPPDGRGLHPLLQHPLVLVHPTLAWAGYAMSAVPFALVGTAVARGTLNSADMRLLNRWSHALWVVLTVAILAGLWWSYVAMGWSGRWLLHPVENGSVLPWIAITAFLLVQRSGKAGAWTPVLPVFGFISSILAALATSAGLFAGGPAFARSPGAVWTIAVASIALLVSADLIRSRIAHLPDLSGSPAPMPRILFLAGALLMAAGLVGVMARREYDVLLGTGESTELAGRTGDWRFASEGISRYNIRNRHVLAVTLVASRDSGFQRIVSSERHDIVDRRGETLFQSASRAAVLRTLREDAYVVLAGVPESDTADLRVTFTPVVSFVWIGGILLLLGGTFMLRPDRAGHA